MGQPRAALVDVGERILELRGVRVLIDHDLSSIYGVPTKVFNQAIKRNAARFPPDFAFRLTREEFDTLRSQFVTSKAGRGGRRHLPLAFTEHGGIMAAAVLNSPRAVEMSVFVVRAFVRLRDSARHYAALARQLAALERRVSIHDGDLKQVFAALRQLLEKPARPRRLIGFGASGA